MKRIGKAGLIALSLGFAVTNDAFAGSGVVPGAHATGIHLGYSVQVSKEDPNGIYYESSLAVDPHNPSHMVAASSASQSGTTYTAFYVTFDGGQTWNRSHTIHSSAVDKAFIKSGDGAVFFAPSGTVFAIVGTNVDGFPKTLVGRSVDGGQTWQTPAVLSYRDRPWMGFDGNKFSATYGRIYAIGQSGAFILSTSNDDGKTFTPGDIFVRDEPGTGGTTKPWKPVPTNILVEPDGTLIEPFTGPDPAHPHNPSAKVATGRIRMIVSDDGGRTFGAARNGPIMHNTNDRRALSDASAALDLSSGPNHGRVYVVYANYESSRYVIRIAYTSDFGKTWNSAIVTDDTKGRVPDNPAVAVSKDGIVAVIWNDRRDDPNGECWRLYGAISIDGGAHFLPNTRMSEGPTCTDAIQNWSMTAWFEEDKQGSTKHLPSIGMAALVPVRFPNGGDTQGLVSDSNGNFHAAWISGETGRLALWQTDFSIDPALLEKIRTSNAKYNSDATEPLPRGIVDVSQYLTFDVEKPSIDFNKHLLVVTVRVVNPTTHDVRGPIDVVLAHLFMQTERGMGLKNLRPENADNGKAGEGTASWTFSAGKDNVLQAGQKTDARVLRFTFEGGPPAEPAGYFIPRFYIHAHT